MVSIHGQNSSRVSLSFENETLKQIFKSITSQTGLEFSYQSDLVNDKDQFSLAVNDIGLEEALDILTAQLNLSYEILEKQIILYATNINLRYPIFLVFDKIFMRWDVLLSLE